MSGEIKFIIALGVIFWIVAGILIFDLFKYKSPPIQFEEEYDHIKGKNDIRFVKPTGVDSKPSKTTGNKNTILRELTVDKRDLIGLNNTDFIEERWWEEHK